MKKILLLTILTLSLVLSGCGESFERVKKDFSSEYKGGLERIVTIYDINGNVLKEYSGKFDIEDREASIKFIVDGKVVIVHKSNTNLIIIEEK